jgi:nicotinamide riboside transporter PnuC
MKRYAWLWSSSRNKRAGWWAALTLVVFVAAIAKGSGELWLLAGVYAIFGVIGWFFPGARGKPRHPPNESTIQWIRKSRRRL